MILSNTEITQLMISVIVLTLLFAHLWSHRKKGGE
jgi:hypothetical protein